MGVFRARLAKLTDKQFHEALVDVLNCVDTHHPNEVRTVVNFVATRIKEEIRQHKLELSTLYQHYLVHGDNYHQYARRINPVLYQFLNCLRSATVKEDNVLMTMEHIYGIAVYNFIGPLSFAKHLILYQISNSKRVCQILCPAGPYASYTTLHRFVDHYTREKLKFPSAEEGDYIQVIDNAQRVIKLHRVLPNENISPLSQVVTANIALLSEDKSHILQEKRLAPSLWMKFVPENMSEKLNLLRAFFTTLMQNALEEYINGKIRRLQEVLTFHNGYYEEVLEPFDKRCLDTFIMVPVMTPEGKIDVQSQRFEHTDHRKFPSLPRHKPPKKARIQHLELHHFNPNSYDRCQQIMESAVQEAWNTGRQFCFLAMDGLPYMYCSRIKVNTYRCPVCGDVKRYSDVFRKHVQKKHDKYKLGDINSHLAYGNLLLLMGMGHVEINATKALSKVLYPVMLKRMGQLFGFKTSKAQDYLQRGVNFRKNFTMLEVMEEGCWLELLTTYINERGMSSDTLDYQGYLHWINNDVTNPDMYCVHGLLLNFLTPLMLHRTAIRHNAHDLMLASRMTFGVMFYGLNMPHYQEIDTKDWNMRIQAPREILNFLTQNELMTYSGQDGRAESADFILEYQIHLLLSMLPKGMPSTDSFDRAWRMYDTLRGVRDIVLKDIVASERPYQRDCTDLINTWRHELRHTGYLKKAHIDSNSTQCIETKGILGNPLHSNIMTLSQTCEQKRQQYWKQFPSVSQDKWARPKVTPVFLVPEDKMKHDLANTTIDQLFSDCMQLCDCLLDTDEKEQGDNIKSMALHYLENNDLDGLYIQLRVLQDTIDNQQLPDATEG